MRRAALQTGLRRAFDPLAYQHALPVTMPPKALTLVAPSIYGGISTYCHYQALAFHRLGIDARVICPEDQKDLFKGNYRVTPIALKRSQTGAEGSRIFRRWEAAKALSGYQKAVAKTLETDAPHPVLTHYSEYLAPLWVSRFKNLIGKGFTFHTVLHDPWRTYKIGPTFWHNHSVRQAFGLYDTVFVHGLERGDTPKDILALRVPHGTYEMATMTDDPQTVRTEVRRRFDIPSNSPLFIQFGFIRDYKNLDLIIEALKGVKEVHLLIAGGENPKDRPASAYQALADAHGVADRCHFDIGFIAPETASQYLTASDYICLTYSSDFLSASGVLATAVHYRKPALVSSGASDLRSVVENYSLGLWIKPDNVAAITKGIQDLIVDTPEGAWALYEADYSWGRNAEIIWDAINGTVPPKAQL